MLRRAALALGFALLATFVACEAWVYTHRTDAPPVDDADLASRWQPVPDAENGHAQLAAAAKALAWPEERVDELRELRAAGGWDHALAQELIGANRSVLAAFDASLETPVYRAAKLDAAYPSPSEIVAETRGWISVDELCSIRALDTAFSGAREDAIDEWLRCFRSGLRRASMEGARVSDAISGVGTQNAALHTLRRILPHARPSAAQSRRWAAEIEALRISGEAWHDVWAEEYRFQSELFAMGASAEPDGTLLRWLVPKAYVVHPNRCRARLADEARALRAVAGLTCAEANVAVWPALPTEEQLGKRVLQMLAPNGVGDFLDTMTIDSWRKVAAVRCGGATAPGVAQTMIALRAYAAAHGELPATLAALVPAYLPRVPADGYDGAPLRYSRGKKLVWSVGDDLRDDGGAAPEDAKCCRPEPRWEIPF
jgi:hypothetical protein